MVTGGRFRAGSWWTYPSPGSNNATMSVVLGLVGFSFFVTGVVALLVSLSAKVIGLVPFGLVVALLLTVGLISCFVLRPSQ
jgi:hypothetical protein